MTVIDDFAHHPTAVRETITAVRQRFSGRRVIAIFEPRSYTAQLHSFQGAYRSALADADRVVLAGLFRPERYDRETGMDPQELAEQLRSDGVEADHIPAVEQIVAAVTSRALPGDVLLVMSNGGVRGDSRQASGRPRARLVTTPSCVNNRGPHRLAADRKRPPAFRPGRTKMASTSPAGSSRWASACPIPVRASKTAPGSPSSS